MSVLRRHGGGNGKTDDKTHNCNYVLLTYRAAAAAAWSGHWMRSMWLLWMLVLVNLRCAEKRASRLVHRLVCSYLIE